LSASKKPTAPTDSFAESVARKVYAAVAAMVAATVARKVVERVWVKTTGKVPPEEPASPAVRWTEAVGWSALSGTAVGVARLLATRKAAGAWDRVSDDGQAAKANGQPNDFAVEAHDRTQAGRKQKTASRSRD
jgi:hypothetical protein